MSAVPKLFPIEYVPIEVLGEGSYASIVLAEDSRQELVCLKCIPSDQVLTRTTLDSRHTATAEAVILNALHDVPHVLRVRDFVRVRNFDFIVTECCRGSDLLQYMADKHVLGELEAQRLLRPVVNALRTAHERGIVHRDLKLDNLFFRDRARTHLVLGDWGLSHRYEPEELESTDFSGSANYAAPELWSGRAYRPAPVDVFALGCSLYGMVAGFLPFLADSNRELHKMIRHAEYERPAHLSASLINLIDGMLHPNADRRLTIQQVMEHPWMQLSASFRSKRSGIALRSPSPLRRAASTPVILVC